MGYKYNFSSQPLVTPCC